MNRHIYTDMCIHTHTHTHTHTRRHIKTLTHTCARTHMNTHALTILTQSQMESSGQSRAKAVPAKKAKVDVAAESAR